MASLKIRTHEAEKSVKDREVGKRPRQGDPQLGGAVPTLLQPDR